jgi:hypothetical protein
VLIDGVACMSTLASPVAEGCTNDDATDETDIERAGLAGRAGANVDGEAGKPPSDGFFAIGGALTFTGVAFGVDCCDETAVLMFAGCG